MISTKRRLAGLVSASAMVATMAVTSMPMAALAAQPAPPATLSSYSNGFEKAGDTIPGAKYDTDNSRMHDVTRVASGTDGIRASSGRFYAKAMRDAFAFTRLGGYSNTFPTNGYTTTVDIYLDMSENKGPATDLRFDWTSAPFSNDPASKGYGRDFVFNVGTDVAHTGKFLVSASNNADWALGTPFPASAITISASGWYTFKHVFRNDGHDVLAVDMSITKKGASAAMATWTLSDQSDVIGPQGIGGNRYGWLATNDFDSVALDNVTRSSN